MFGLSEREFSKLMRLIMAHATEFKKVILFGSRARGDYKAHSDIDLAIRYAHRQKASSFQEEIELSILPYTVDIIDLSLEKKTKLKIRIQKEGVVLYDAKNKNRGEFWMSHAALKEKLADFQSALAQLHEALSKDIQSDSMYLDATIQRFEFTYELCWKLMKAYLDYLGIEVNNPRAAIRESMKQKIIQDTPLWMTMIEKRNLTTHTYHQELAIEVYHAIQSHFIRLLRDFDKKIAPLVRAIKAK